VQLRAGNYRLIRKGVFVLGRPQPTASLRCITRAGGTPFSALRRHLGLLVFVIGVAGSASGLLHLVVNHRDDGVIRDAALARAIVVQNVTEPKPALLHQKFPRNRVLSGGIQGAKVKRV
jgi:hypothetical protein